MTDLRFFDEFQSELERASLTEHPTRASRLYRWARRKVVIGGFGVPPAVLIAIVATAAAATGGAVLVSHSTTKPAAHPATTPPLKPTTLFRKNPGSPFAHRKRMPPNVIFRKETVIPGTVRERVSSVVPKYGRVQFWAATTKQGGFCFAIKLPNGSWAGYPMTRHLTGGFDGGTMPGCIDTDQQRSIGENGQPSSEAPTIFEGFQDYVKSRTGRAWELFFGYVTTQGHATTVKDPWTGDIAPVTPDGYFLLVEPPSNAPGNDMLNVLDASGHLLQPDYTRSGLLPGYKMGPTSGPRP